MTTGHPDADTDTDTDTNLAVNYARLMRREPIVEFERREAIREERWAYRYDAPTSDRGLAALFLRVAGIYRREGNKIEARGFRELAEHHRRRA